MPQDAIDCPMTQLSTQHVSTQQRGKGGAGFHRRHMTPSQIAMVGDKARDFYDKAAKDRQKIRKGDQPGATPATLPELSKGDSRDIAGKAVGESGY